MLIEKDKWSKFTLACNNLKFCPCEISYDGRKFLGTRCWEWLRHNKDKQNFDDNFEYPIIENPTLVVWNIDDHKFEYLEIEKLDYAYVSDYKGQMYFK